MVGLNNYSQMVVTGTGSAIECLNEHCSFVVRKVRILNITDGSTHEWNSTMAAGTAVSTKSAAAYVSTGGITGGITGSDFGFTIGTNSDLNTAGDVLHVEVYG